MLSLINLSATKTTLIVPTFIVSSIRTYQSNTSTIKTILKNKINRVSIAEPKANELIEAIRDKNYNKARYLVIDEGVNVNGHTTNENTALTDAAKRGDIEDLKFLLTELKANPHASCDCPHHKTALHYASENNYKEAVEILLKNGANPNVLDSRNYTAKDLTNNQQVVALLEQYKPATSTYLPSK